MKVEILDVADDPQELKLIGWDPKANSI